MTDPGYWPVNRLRQYAAGVWLVAGGLAVWGSFTPLVRQDFGRGQTFVLSAWGDDDNPASAPQLYGVLITVGVVLLAIAAGLALLSTRQHPASAQVLAARLVGTGGTGLLLGSIGTLVAIVLNLLRSFGEFPRGGPTVTLELGIWILGGACVVALVAVVLMLVPKINREEPETPSMGMPVVRVLDAEYDAPDPEDTAKQG